MDGLQNKYCCPQGLLPKNFSYPEGYFEYIFFDDEESDENEFISTISFLETERITSFFDELKQFSMFRTLIPFGKNEDELYCFDERAENIYVIDLGDTPLKASKLPYQDFFEFINAIRISNRLSTYSVNIEEQ